LAIVITKSRKGKQSMHLKSKSNQIKGEQSMNLKSKSNQITISRVGTGGQQWEQRAVYLDSLVGSPELAQKQRRMRSRTW
jgi:hypothetical protein